MRVIGRLERHRSPETDYAIVRRQGNVDYLKV